MLFPWSIPPLFLLLLLIVALTPCTPAAERPILKPQDFKPLTEIPWTKKDDIVTPMKQVMEAIFREPNATVRLTLLQVYLNEIPVEQIGRAFNLAIEQENSQTLDELVEVMLRTWARRDPHRCWSRVKELFRVVGLEDGWLMFDDWDVKRSAMLVQDRAALQASPFRLRRDALLGFPVGVDNSEIAPSERVRLMQDFLRHWFEAFDTWPESQLKVHDARWTGDFVGAFTMSGDAARTYCGQTHQEYEAATILIALRRWLVGAPSEAPQILTIARDLKDPLGSEAPPEELFRLWADTDRAGMIKWAESPDKKPDALVIRARGLLISEVDEATRARWLTQYKVQDEDDRHFTPGLFRSWAAWDPKGALDAAIQIGDPGLITSVGHYACCGPYMGHTMNAARLGFRVVRDLDITSLPETLRKDIMEDWGMSPLEGWGGIDAGGTARFGITLLETFNYYSVANDDVIKDEVIEFFAGRNNEYRDGGHVVDRTFCSLRTWAATKPTEMKAWVATLKDAKLREALTWLADNPWGPGRIPPP